MADEDAAALQAKVAALQAEIDRLRGSNKQAAESLTAATARAAAAEAEAAKLQQASAGFAAAGEASAAAQARASKAEAELAAATARAARNEAMADAGLPKAARDFFGFRYEQQAAADGKPPDVIAFVAGLAQDPVAMAFRGAALPPMQQAPPIVPAAPPAAAPPIVPGPPAIVPPPLPDTQRGAAPGGEGGPGTYTPGSVVRAAKENPAALALQHGIKLNNPERFGLAPPK